MGISKKLKNIFGVREMYILLTIILAILLVSIYSSMALFSVNVEKLGVAKIVAKDITPIISTEDESFTVDDDNHSGTITIGSKEEKFFEITLSNDSAIPAAYKLYYQIQDLDEENIEIGVSNKSTNPGTGIINKGDSKKVKLGIRNDKEEEATINIGVQAGYEHNEITLNTDRKELKTIIEGRNLAKAILEDNKIVTESPNYTYYPVTASVPKDEYPGLSTDIGLFKEQGKKEYYYRGLMDNNYVEFGKYKTNDGNNTVGNPIVWRILRVNEDGSVRLIVNNSVGNTEYDGDISTGDYGSSTYSGSKIETYLNNWYSNNLGNTEFDKYILGLYCYGNGKIEANNVNPSVVCNKSESKVSLISRDDAIYVGDTFHIEYIPIDSWLCNSNIKNSVTSTAESGYTLYRVCSMSDTAYIEGGVFPVITLSAEAPLADDSGNGTVSSPYKIEIN